MALGFAGEGWRRREESPGEGMEEWRKTPALKLRQRLGVEAPVTRGGLLHSPVSASQLGREDVEGAGASGGGTVREAALGSASRGLAELR